MWQQLADPILIERRNRGLARRWGFGGGREIGRDW